jgi:hypothetical protein
VIFDCHSLSNIGPPGAPDRLQWRKDIVLGNNGGNKGEGKPTVGTITCPTETLLMMKEVFEESVINGCFDAGNLMGPVYEDEIVTRRLYDGVVDIGFKFIIKRPTVLNGFPKTLLMFIGCIDVSIIILNVFQLALFSKADSANEITPWFFRCTFWQ